MKEKEQRHSQEKKDEEKQRGAEIEANLELPSMTLPEKVQHKGSGEHGSLPGSEPAAVLARLQESRETRTSRSTTPGVQQEGGAGPGGLPASRAAVVMASQKESRETETSGVLQQAERGGRDTASAEVLVQEVQELVIEKEMELPQEKTSDPLKTVIETRKKASREDENSSSDESIEEEDGRDLLLTRVLESL